MARLLACAIAIALTAPAPARADDLGVPDFAAIRTPDAPAFTLLGAAPAQIERPNAPKQVSAALGGFLVESASAVPKSVAIEVAPYWLWSHPDLTLEDYRARSALAQLGQNLTVSLATAAGERATTDPMGMPIFAEDVTLAIGVRTSVQLTRAPVPACDAALADLVRMARGLSLQQHPDYAEAIALPPADAKPVLQRIQAEIAAQKAAALEMVAARASACVIGGGLDARGWSLEAALATSFVFADRDPKAGAARAEAAWITVAHKWLRTSVVGLVRLRADEVADGRDLGLDTGLRVIYARGRVAVSVEGIARLRLAETDATAARDHTYRAGLGFDLRLAGATWAGVAFGKDFAGDTTGKLFSLANVKWGFGDPQVTR